MDLLNFLTIVTGLLVLALSVFFFHARSVRPELSRGQDLLIVGCGVACGAILIFRGSLDDRVDPFLSLVHCLLILVVGKCFQEILPYRRGSALKTRGKNVNADDKNR